MEKRTNEKKPELDSKQAETKFYVKTNLSVFTQIFARLINSPVINVLFLYICVFHLEFKSYLYVCFLVIGFNIFRNLIEKKVQVTQSGEFVSQTQFSDILNTLPWTHFAKIGTEKLWVNRIISNVWGNITSNHMKSKLPETLCSKMIVVKEFDIGEKPVTVNNVYCSTKKTSDGFLLLFDVPFEFYSKRVGIMFAFVMFECITAGIEELYIKGSLRIIIRLDNFEPKVAPEIRELRCTFTEQPTVVYCKAKGILTPLEWISNSETFISKVIANYLLLPKSVTIRFGGKKDKEENDELNASKSIVRIDVLYAAQMILKQRDIINVVTDHIPNTFCTVVLGNSSSYATRVIESNYPVWNQYFIFPVGSENISLEIKLYDSMEEKDDLLFTYKCDDIFKEFMAINGKEKVLKLTDNRSIFHSGSLTFRVNILSLSKSREDLVKSAALRSYRFPSGVFSVRVNSATGLQNLPKHEVLHSRVLTTFVEVTLGHLSNRTDMKTGNSPIWDQVLHFICHSPLQNVTFTVYARIKTTDYCLGFFETSVQVVLTESSSQTIQFPLQGVSKDAHLNVTLRFNPAIPMKGFLATFCLSEKRISDSIRRIPGIESKKEEEPTMKETRKFSDSEVHILLRFVWHKAKETKKLVVDIIEVKNIPKINGKEPDPYVIIELLNDSLEVLESKRTVIQRFTSNPVYKETKCFEKIKAHLIDTYFFRVSVYFKATKKYQHNKIAEEMIQFPNQLKEGVGYYQQWYPLVISHRGTEGLAFIDHLRSVFGDRDPMADDKHNKVDDVTALFDENNKKPIEGSKETMFLKCWKLFGFTKNKEKAF